jgi:3-phosphoshikimate 1-carboxyvinyltransferase
MSTIALTPLSAPVHAAIAIPGSKSYTNRAMVMAALADHDVTILNPLRSDDTEAMKSCLNRLGVNVDDIPGGIRVRGTVSRASDGPRTLDARDSGTTIRFLTAAVCLAPGTTTIGGSARLNERPIGPLVNGLRQLGADIRYLNKEGVPPLVISGTLRSGMARMSGDISSQYFSALLMVAPYIGGVTIEVDGNQISKPYIDMTLGTMAEWGVVATNEEYRRYVVPAGTYNAITYQVEGDYSSAGYFFAIAALTRSTVRLSNLNPQSKQADRTFLSILEEMGNTITTEGQSVTLHGQGIKAVSVDMEACPDQVQTLAVLAAFAPGITQIRGVRSLRVKETERVVAIQNELEKMGIKTEATHDSLTIHGGSPRAASIETYRDHRMAMAFSVAGSVLPGMRIEEPHVVEKTFPTYWQLLASTGVGVTSS